MYAVLIQQLVNLHSIVAMNAGTLNVVYGEIETEFVVSAQQPCCSERSGTETAIYPCNEGVMLIADSVESRLLERVRVNSERQASLRTCILQPIVGCGAT